MLGAVYFHVTILGINQLFWMAIIVIVCSIYVLYVTQEKRKKVLGVG
jgi:hypothetical protein